jgi:hypothetical protein
VPVHKYRAVYNLRFESFHGMEEVIGSIPSRRRAGLALAPASHVYEARGAEKARIWKGSNLSGPRKIKVQFETHPIYSLTFCDALFEKT